MVYLGHRPLDSIRLHRQYASATTYPFRFEHLLENHKLAHLMPLVFAGQDSVKERPFTGMNPQYEGALRFDSQFESGNLDLVVQVSECEYDLFMRVDSNTKGHLSWYNFKVWGLQRSVRLNICNFTKSKCLYSKGMRPYVRRNVEEWA